LVDKRLKSPLRVDLHTAMGDPLGADRRAVPSAAIARAMLQHGEITAAEYWYLRALRRYLTRDFHGATDALNLVLLQEPALAEAHFLKGICLQLAALETAELSTDFPDAIPPHAHTLLLKARWSFAIVLDLNPGDEEARTYLAGIEALLR
jgi:hypothetical protein